MILFNTTFHVDEAVEREFLVWLRERFLPAAVADGQMTSPMLARLMTTVGEGTRSFALHLKAADETSVERWENTMLATLLSEMYGLWGERVLAFSTPMEILEE